jgi:hypothetical protein
MKRICTIAALALSALLLMASAASAVGTVTTDPTQAPSGTHLRNNSPSPTCMVTATSVTCPAETFVLGGVGNTNATETLTANYTATINCTNKGGSLVESHNQDVTASSGPNTLRPDKNGQIVVDPVTVNAPTNAQVLQQADCPNRNWRPSVQGGSVTLASFSYTLTFAGFTSPYLTITG